MFEIGKNYKIDLSGYELEERKAIFEVHLKPLKSDTKVDIDFLARQTPGFSGADIANLVLRAGIQVGIGEGRPFSKNSCGMGWGTFEITSQEG